MATVLSPPLAALLLLIPVAVADAREGEGRETLRAPSILEQLNACPPSESPDEIVVCGRRDDDRYRLPIRDQHFDPDGPQDSVARERGRLLEGGEAGIGSCSTVGPGGYTGCFAQAIKRRQQQQAGR